jgi:hypothetical protein
MNDEMEIIWNNEAVVAYFKVPPPTFALRD